MSRPWNSLPGEGKTGLLGSLGPFRAAPHRYPAELANAHGGLARFRILHRRLLAVSDPRVVDEILAQKSELYVRGRQYRNMQQALGRGLLATMGPGWKERRALLNPLFRADRLRRVVQTSEAATNELLRRWEAQRRAGVPVAAVTDSRWLSITVMARTLFTHDLAEPEVLRLSELIQRGTALIRRKNTSVWNPPAWVPTQRNREFAQIRGFVDQLLVRELDRHPPEPGGGEDNLLGAIVALRDPHTGHPLPRDAVLDELRTLFTAGFETTSAALAWTLWRLARHPEVAAKWRAEIDQLPADQPLSPDLLKRLPYTDQVIQESLRLHPPVYNMARVAQADDELAGYHIPRGTIAMISIYGLHRSPALWNEPGEFRPERFANPHSPAARLIPFGAGPHLCIGMAFALFELKTALTCLGRRYHFRLTDNREIPERAEISLSPACEIPLRLEPRE
jgi:cytochrome P450